MNQKVSKRIKALVSMVGETYDVVWDLCCDHGKIGVALAEKSCAKTYNFVDQVPSIITKLNSTLGSYIPSGVNYNTFATPAEKISIDNNLKNLIVLAGIGTDTIISILEQINYNQISNSHILVSTNKYPHKLRSFLQKGDYKIIKEQLIEENGHFYEMLLLAKDGNLPISSIGQEMWDINNSKHLEYIDRTIAYNEIKAKHGDSEAKELLNQLKMLKKQFASG
jgi:tRNA (adenine22-N1)-methyltransferase